MLFRSLDRAKIDDPIFAISVHGIAGIWGTISTGFFATPTLAAMNGGEAGLFYGGGFMSEIGGLLLGSKIHVSFIDLVLIFIIRTSIALGLER